MTTPAGEDPVHVRPASAAEIIDLRHAVLRPGFPREAAVFEVDRRADTHHFAAVDAHGRVVGCVTLSPRESGGDLDRHNNDVGAGGSLQLRAMAVDERLRGAGVGRRLLEKVDQHVRALPPPTPLLWCNARIVAIPFYQRCGWTVVSEVFEIPPIGPHVRMTREV